MEYIQIKLWIKNDKRINDYVVEWLRLIKFIKAQKLTSGIKNKCITQQYSEVTLESILANKLEKSKCYQVEITGTEIETIQIYISPFLNEVNCLYACLPVNKLQDILVRIEAFANRYKIMCGWIHPNNYNKYHERGVGHIEMGAYWRMYLGKWALQYIDEVQYKVLEEYTNLIQKENYVIVSLADNLQECMTDSFEKKQRQLMKKMKYIESIYRCYRTHHFTDVEIED